MVLAGCGDGDAAQDDAASDDVAQSDEGAEGGEGQPEQPEQPDLPDPAENIEDGVYSGNGVLLPVPDGWAIDPGALQQGVVAALDEGGEQQLTAQAIDAEALAASGQELDLDTLVDGLRQQVPQEPEVDEEVELAGAARAHRLTYTDLPGQQEGGEESSATIVVAEDGEGLFGEFAFTATADAYEPEVADLLLAEAGFDPDSEPLPPPPPQPQQPPAPEGGDQSGAGGGGGGG